jgi:hypothetical protein
MTTSANITWSNPSYSISPPPDGTIVERVEQTSFSGLSADDYITEIANGNTGGLLATNATGSFTDTTLSPGKNYSYRVKTTRGTSETKISAATPHEFIVDPAKELSFPSSIPPTGGYTTTVAPAIHMDASRISGIGTSDDPADKITDASLAFALRVAPPSVSLKMQYNAALTGGHIRLIELDRVNSYNVTNTVRIAQPFQYMSGTTGYAGLELKSVDTPILSRDGATVFYVVYDQLNRGSNLGQVFGSQESGLKSVGDGLPDITNPATTLQIGANKTMQIIRTSMSTANTSNHLQFIDDSPTGAGLNIYALRLDASEDKYNNNNIRVQLWKNGVYAGATEDTSPNNWRSAENSWINMYGAYVMHSSAYATNYNHYYANESSGIAEHLVYLSAIDYNDMNSVMSYLQDKFAIPVTSINPNDIL